MNSQLASEEMQKRIDITAKDLDIGHLRGRSLHELSSNLDMDAIRDLKRHLALVKKQGKTILIAEHRLYYLMDIIDRVVYMEL